jgi:hypothetical protein
MIRNLLIAVGLCLALFSDAVAFKPRNSMLPSVPKLEQVPLSSLSTDLSAVDDGGVLDAVQVYTCDIEPYGSFFTEFARIQATLLLADTLTAQFAREMVAAGFQAGDVQSVEKTLDGLEPWKLQSLRLNEQRLVLLVPYLTWSAARVPALMNQVPRLKKSAKRDFGGGLFGGMRSYQAIQVLASASSQLEDAGAHSVQTLNMVQRMLAAIDR